MLRGPALTPSVSGRDGVATATANNAVITDAVKNSPLIASTATSAGAAHAAQSNSPLDRQRLALVWPVLRSQIHPSDHRIPRAWPGRNCFEQLATDRAA